MKKNRFWISVAVIISMTMAMAGCETAGQSAGLGALVGAGTGAVIGGHHHAGEGALIGAAVGAMTGLVVHGIKTQRTKDAQQTAQRYQQQNNNQPYKSEQGLKIYGSDANITPSKVKRGQTVSASVEYGVLGSGPDGVKVSEKRMLRQNGNVIRELSKQDFVRTDGTWQSSLDIDIPQSLNPGQYEIVNLIASRDTQYERALTFTVE